MKTERFVKLPIDRALVWDGLSWFQRALGADMFRVFQEREHSVGPNWEAAVCSALGVSGRERGNVVRALRGIAEAGVLTVRNGVLRLLYSESSFRSIQASQVNLHSTSIAPPLDIHSTSTRHPL